MVRWPRSVPRSPPDALCQLPRWLQHGCHTITKIPVVERIAPMPDAVCNPLITGSSPVVASPCHAGKTWIYKVFSIPRLFSIPRPG
jgi:hypothetical protein